MEVELDEKFYITCMTGRDSLHSMHGLGNGAFASAFFV